MKYNLPTLNKGDEIKIISTARKISENELQAAFNFVINRGYSPSPGKNLYKRDHQFAGSDQQRFEDLQNALDDPGLKVIWMARGGYGTHRIISDLNFESFLKYPKWIIGYSDVTVLHCLINSMNAPSLHASMPINFEDQDHDAFKKIFSALEGEKLTYTIKPNSKNVKGLVKGKVFGGNLSILYSLTGTQLLPDLNGAILFFEDLDEYLYHVDRMLMNLKLSGVLNSIGGLIVGGLSGMNDNPIPFGKTAEEIVQEHTSKLNIPICFGFPAGHQKENFPILFGEEATLKVNENGAQLSY